MHFARFASNSRAGRCHTTALAASSRRNGDNNKGPARPVTKPRGLGPGKLDRTHRPRRAPVLSDDGLCTDAEKTFLFDVGFGTPGLIRRPPADLDVNPKAKVLRLIEQGSTNYRPSPEMGRAVHSLITSSPNAPPVKRASAIGQGTWEVFYAPHIAELSRTLLGTRFEPIRYTFRGDQIVSHVKYRGPVVGTGWLSSSGTYQSLESDRAVRICFDEFWLDIGEDALREEFHAEPVRATNFFSWTKRFADRAMVDHFIGTLGRAAFFPALSVFPVSYLDDDIAVFSFEPSETVIAVRHISK